MRRETASAVLARSIDRAQDPLFRLCVSYDRAILSDLGSDSPGCAFSVPGDRGTSHRTMFRGAFGLLYLVIGVAVAASYDYLDRLTTLARVVSAVLAIVLWPLLLVGIDLRVRG